MHHEVHSFDDLDELARAGAAAIADAARTTLAERAHFDFAVSGGRTPWRALADLAASDVDWSRARVFQVDERVVPAGDDARNLGHLRASVADTALAIEPMPVEDADLEAAARRYGERLPAAFDLVHLGLGADGHCASLVPGDPVLDVLDAPVALTGPYQGTRRMTLTYPVLNGARQVLWLVAGADKRDALARLLDGDPTIPAGRVESARSLVLCDRAARGA